MRRRKCQAAHVSNKILITWVGGGGDEGSGREDEDEEIKEGGVAWDGHRAPLKVFGRKGFEGEEAEFPLNEMASLSPIMRSVI